MGYFPVRYDSRVVNYDRRGFIRLATGIRYVNRNSIQTILWQNKSFTTLNPSPALDGNEMEGARLRSALTKMKFELGLSLLAISLR